MPKRDWIIPLALGLGILIVALICAAYFVGSRIGETRGERNYHSANYERHASDEIRNTCLAGQGGDVAECIAKVIDATNENQRAQDDLVAQTEMATWAFWMLIATVVMAVITLTGVVFVWLTLRETAAGVMTMRQEQRPWLKIEAVPDGPLLFTEKGKFMAPFLVKTTNVGKSPATSVFTDVRFVPEMLLTDERRNYYISIPSGMSNSFGSVIFPNDIQISRHRADIDIGELRKTGRFMDDDHIRLALPSLFVVVVYESERGTGKHVTCHGFSLSSLGLDDERARFMKGGGEIGITINDSLWDNRVY